MDQDSGGPLSKRFCLPDDGHSCDTCVWHYEDIWHSTECPRCCHAPEHVAAPRNTPAMDEDGKPCTCTEMGPRPCHWWPIGLQPEEGIMDQDIRTPKDIAAKTDDVMEDWLADKVLEHQAKQDRDVFETMGRIECGFSVSFDQEWLDTPDGNRRLTTKATVKLYDSIRGALMREFYYSETFTTKALSEVPDGYAEAWGLKNVFNEIVRKWIDEWRPNAPAKRK